MSFSTKATNYFLSLRSSARLSDGVDVINPYKLPEVKNVVRVFYNKFYNDDNKRIYMFGINPGRFGGGLTGIAFTDPVALKKYCNIENNLGERKELSSKFIYELITEYGGVKKFFSNVFMTALFPLALTRNGKNFNYYGDNKVFELLRQDIIGSVHQQIEFGARVDKVIILGKKNADFFRKINEENKLFSRIYALDHPRFIMQYRKKQINKYISSYLKTLDD